VFSLARSVAVGSILALATTSCSSPGAPSPDAAGHWVGTWGGADPAFTTALRVTRDASGNAYVVGTFGADVDLDPGPGALRKSAAPPVATDGPPRDAYLSKFDARHELEWVRTWGGSAYDYATDVAADAEGNVFVAGYVYSAGVTFDPPAAGFEGADAQWVLDATKAYVLKYGADGAFRWARAWTASIVPGAVHPTLAFGLALDASGNVYVVGDYEGTVDFDGTTGADVRQADTDGRVYVVSYASSGAYRWVRTFGNGRAESAAFDGDGIAVTGYTLDTADWDPTAGVVSYPSQGRQNVFTARFSTDGAFRWCRFVDGDGQADMGRSVVADGAGGIYVAGGFGGTASFDGPGGSDVHGASQTDVFLIKYATDGTYAWGIALGGAADDVGLGVAADPAAGVALAGTFTGEVDFDPGERAVLRTASPTSFFVGRFRADGALEALATGGPSVGSGGLGLAFDARSALYVAGTFWGTADFDPSDGLDERKSTGGADAFLWYATLPPP
jgi:hypothetical protein